MSTMIAFYWFLVIQFDLTITGFTNILGHSFCVKQTQITGLMEQISTLESEGARMTDELSERQKDIDQNTLRIEASEAALQDAKNDKDELKREIEQLRRQNADAENYQRQLAEKMADLRREMGEQLETIYDQKVELIDTPVAELKRSAQRLAEVVAKMRSGTPTAPAAPVAEGPATQQKRKSTQQADRELLTFDQFVASNPKKDKRDTNWTFREFANANELTEQTNTQWKKQYTAYRESKRPEEGKPPGGLSQVKHGKGGGLPPIY